MSGYSLGRKGSLFLVAGFLLACGCSVSFPSGIVSGKVSVKGQPVRGEVNFYMKEKGQGAVARVDESGRYQFDTPLPIGTYAVYIKPLPPEPVNPANVGVRNPTADIPPKFQEPSTSGLTFTVKAGRN